MKQVMSAKFEEWETRVIRETARALDMKPAALIHRLVMSGVLRLERTDAAMFKDPARDLLAKNYRLSLMLEALLKETLDADRYGELAYAAEGEVRDYMARLD